MSIDLTALRTSGTCVLGGEKYVSPCNRWACSGSSGAAFGMAGSALILILGTISLIGHQYNYPHLAFFAYNTSVACTVVGAIYFPLTTMIFLLGRKFTGERMGYLQKIADNDWKNIKPSEIYALENELLRLSDELKEGTEQQRRLCTNTFRNLQAKSASALIQDSPISLLDCSLAAQRLEGASVGYAFKQVTSLDQITAFIDPKFGADLFQTPHTFCFLAYDAKGEPCEGLFLQHDVEKDIYIIFSLFICNPSSNLEMKRALAYLIRCSFLDKLKKPFFGEMALHVHLPLGDALLKERFEYLGFRQYVDPVNGTLQMTYSSKLFDQ